ncbi:serine/threonine-protein phosphatase 4 regulatory subunit 1-like isoform X2 [Rhynchophorus ferrugineus]|uniref:serine/threonine-protein phosphatase 4 regulatory subunit 1-like isoform X2 n=1 Tax=Rhynchophorus ferrugineus TaxID=354439 RepID=UPI003FCE34E6
MNGFDSSISSYFQNFTQKRDEYDGQGLPRMVQGIFTKVEPETLTMQLPNIMTKLMKLGDRRPQLVTLLKNIPEIAAKAIENSDRVPALRDVIGEYLLPLVVRNITGSCRGIDAASYTVLELIKRGFVSRFQAEIKICPSILALTKKENDWNVLPGIISTMSKLATLLGRDVTERIFLNRYLELCSSQYFPTRKIAADHIGYYCAIVSKDVFENKLLPHYLALCQDENWGIRKSCAEVIIFVSSVCSPTLRNTLVTQTFMNLLQDEHRWVRILTYQSLGAFIVTFANPPLTTIQYDADGDVILANKDGQKFQPPYDDAKSLSARGEDCFTTSFNILELVESCPTIKPHPVKTIRDYLKTDNNSVKHEDDLLYYNEYNYWHISPPDVDPNILKDLGVTTKEATTTETVNALADQLENLYSTISLNDNFDDNSNKSIVPYSDIIGDTVVEENIAVNNLDNTTAETNKPSQDVVPQVLVDKFILMAQGENNTDDYDLSYLCAYSLPAVILTLGKENWSLLKDTAVTLAGHKSYKIRRIVASSLHELANILGQEHTDDLIELFDGFLKDLDEVRIKTLLHLGEFFDAIHPKKRLVLLPKLEDFLRGDNMCNWRFHETVAQQFTLLVKYFEPNEIVKSIGLHAQPLMWYNVAAIRHAAVGLVTEIVKRISCDRALTSSYLMVIAERFAHSKIWKPRQTFVVLCRKMLQENALEIEEFASILWPHLLDLSWDPIANIRLMVAECIVEHIVTNEYFLTEDMDCLQKVLRRLQTDKDRDVRLAAMCSL